jgi:hypothetical protein
MSALGQKQTYALQQAMSALPPIATSIAYFRMSDKGQWRTWRRMKYAFCNSLLWQCWNGLFTECRLHLQLEIEI